MLLRHILLRQASWLFVSRYYPLAAIPKHHLRRDWKKSPSINIHCCQLKSPRPRNDRCRSAQYAVSRCLPGKRSGRLAVGRKQEKELSRGEASIKSKINKGKSQMEPPICERNSSLPFRGGLGRGETKNPSHW